MVYFILVINILFLVSANILIKKGALDLGEINFSLPALMKLIPQTFKSPYLLGGLFSYGMGFLLWIFLLSRLNLNIVYPIGASAAIALIAVISWFLFKETLSVVQIFGVVAVIAGIFLILK